MILLCPSALLAMADGPAPILGPVNPATLFGASEKGTYYNFTNGASLAVNADGTGGTPAVGAACSSVLDLSPNGNRLRNTVGSVTRRANGVETSGAGYGLFNMAGFGDWPAFGAPYEIMICFEQMAYGSTYARIIGSGGGPWGLLQSTASGQIAWFDSTLEADVAMPIGQESVFHVATISGGCFYALDGGTPVTFGGAGTGLDGIVLGSGSGGGNNVQMRVKHLLVIGRALTAGERSGVVQWMQA